MRHTSLFLLIFIVGAGLFVFSPKFSNRRQQASAGQERQVILVAAKDLPVGMEFSDDNLNKSIRKKVVGKIDVPSNAILNSEELIGLTVTSNHSSGSTITTKNLRRVSYCGPGPDKHPYTLKLPYESFGPWVRAGVRVNVLCSHRQPGSDVVRYFNLLNALPVIIVEYPDMPNKLAACGPLFLTVTLECSLEESHWLQLAQDAKAHLRFIVINERSDPFAVPTDEERYALFNNTVNDKQMRPGPIK